MHDATRDQPRIFEQAIEGQLAWDRSGIATDDWRVEITGKALDEIAECVGLLRNNPLDPRLLSPEDFSLDACIELMGAVKRWRDTGRGFAVLDRLPTASYSKGELTSIYWLLSSMIARPVAQSFSGTVLYDVRDTGQLTATRVRGDLTSQELSWHTDYGFNFPPPYLGLLVLRTAREGGVSGVASMMTAHNVLLRRDPRLLRRLYRPFHWNRQGEHPDGAPVTHDYPIFQYDGESVRGRISPPLIYRGYELVEAAFDTEGRDAIQALCSIMSEPRHHLSFELERGQLQFINNFKMAHSRTDYVDHDEPDAKRHLVRIFLRDGGRRSYMG